MQDELHTITELKSLVNARSRPRDLLSNNGIASHVIERIYSRKKRSVMVYQKQHPHPLKNLALSII